MPAEKMHADELDINSGLVRRLLAAQLPRFADLPVTPVASAGTDNALFRLGDDLVVRLPRIRGAAEALEREYRWLPMLAPRLPLAVPAPLAMGEPAEGYPLRWAVYRWLDGENAVDGRIADPHEAARSLGRFVSAMQRIDPDHDSPRGRGGSLAARDEETRAAIAASRGLVDVDAVTAAWEDALRVPAWPGPPRWVHGDLHALNLLVDRGRLRAVIDFGGVGVGDPACDAMAAWLFLTAETRATFREAIRADDATWARGRGWALSVGVVALPYYQATNPVFARVARRAIDEALADQ